MNPDSIPRFPEQWKASGGAPRRMADRQDYLEDIHEASGLDELDRAEDEHERSE